MTFEYVVDLHETNLTYLVTHNARRASGPAMVGCQMLLARETKRLNIR